MEREKEKNVKQNENDISKRKWYSLIGFLISIVLLSIAIFMSINQENTRKLAELTADNTIEVASTDFNKNVSQANRMVALSNDYTENTVNDIIKAEREIVSDSTEAQNDSSRNETSQSEKTDTESQEETSIDNQVQENDEGYNNETINEEKKLDPNQFIKPIDGEEIGSFSMDSLVYSNTLQEWITHRGIDIKSEKGVEVVASKDGKVKAINNDPRYGVSIIIEHSEGFTTVYSCLLDTANLSEGDNVNQGQVIGHIGNSGVFEVADGMHLHFEMLKDGEYINPDIYLK